MRIRGIPRSAAVLLAASLSAPPGCTPVAPEERGSPAGAPSPAEQLELARDRLRRGEYVEAAGAYRASAEQGQAEAQFSLGVLYALGQGVQADLAEAVRWYSRAAEASGAAARYNLGEKYNQGVPGRSVDDARSWIAALSRLGEASSPLAVGSDYHFGAQGLPKDAERAYHWFGRAAEQGHAMAWYRLAQLHLEGRGAPRDPVRAYMWFSLCAARGLGDAQWRVRDLAARMSAEELAEAQRLAAEWKPAE